jgi:hypothetical protein
MYVAKLMNHYNEHCDCKTDYFKWLCAINVIKASEKVTILNQMIVDGSLNNIHDETLQKNKCSHNARIGEEVKLC